jgi:hypothetical protein
MPKLLAIVAVLASVVSAQAADVIPPEYRGAWCDQGAYLIQKSKLSRGERCSQAFSLTATTLTGRDAADCKLTQIKSVFVDGVDLPEGVFTCPDGTIEFEFTTGSGSMGYKTRRLYTEYKQNGE